MYEFSGKTYEEAIQKALNTLNVKEDEVEIEKISDKPNSLLDILKEKQTGQVFIRVKIKNQSKENSIKNKDIENQNLPEHVQKSLEIIRNIANLLETDIEITTKSSSDEYIILIEGKDKGMLIGKHGNTLNAIQNYINFIVNKNLPKEQRNHIIIDSDNYRERRKKQLIDLALKTAKIVQQKKEPITLAPMLAFERKIIHMALKDNQYVTTYSIGENPYKSVVIAPLLGSSESFFS